MSLLSKRSSEACCQLEALLFINIEVLSEKAISKV